MLGRTGTSLGWGAVSQVRPPQPITCLQLLTELEVLDDENLPSPVQQLQQHLLESRPLAPLHPELRVVRVADLGPPLIQITVDQRVVSFAPVLQTGVESLHQEVHHTAVGGVPNEEHL